MPLVSDGGERQAPVAAQGLLFHVDKAAEAAGALGAGRVNLLREAVGVARQEPKLAHERARRHVYAVLPIRKLHNRPAHH